MSSIATAAEEIIADERYTLVSRLEIVAQLRGLADSRAAVTIHFGQGGFIVTNLLQVNPEFEELIFDVGADEEANARLLRAARMTVVSMLEGVKLQFGAQRAEPTRYEGLPAIRIRVPDEMLRLQRREHFRVKTPLVNAVHVRVPSPAAPGVMLKLRILDISVGGIAIAAPADSPALEIGTRVPRCRVDLPDAEPISVSLEIRNLTDVAEAGGRSFHRYGCRFVDLPKAAVNVVQRYVLDLERAQRSSSPGGNSR